MLHPPPPARCHRSCVCKFLKFQPVHHSHAGHHLPFSAMLMQIKFIRPIFIASRELNHALLVVAGPLMTDVKA